MIAIDSNSLVGKLYRYWQRRGGKNKYDYQENLCHFVRVCVFWAPWYGFWRHPLFGTFMAPWSMLLVILFIVCLASVPILITLAVRIILVCLVVIFLAFFLAKKKVFVTVGEKVRNASAVVKKPVLGTVEVIASWLMAQKRKVCPYVEIV